MTTPRLYKVLDADNRSTHGGRGRWTPGRWRSVSGPLDPCHRGLHLCRADQLIDWLGPRIWEAEAHGEVIEQSDKVVVRRARITREVTGWDERTARLFAADCAAEALPFADPAQRETLARVIAVARRYADGEVTDAELSAAESAAWSAARSVAESAAWSAAESAAWSAARSAAWSAARERQTARLVALLGLEG